MDRYRPEIDGLRALAVIPVILFHAGVEYLPRGYVGVDIFFVISGYVITNVIFNDINDGCFSLIRFYQRRIARIFPAFFVMLGVSGIVASATLIIPKSEERFFESLVASSLFISNFYFWNEANYFSNQAKSFELLHTWSLSVEEQFYIFYPIFIMILHRFIRNAMSSIICGTMAISLAAGCFVNVISASTDFYLLAFRMWELLIGGLLALGAVPNVDRKLRLFASIAGCCIIGLSLRWGWHNFPSPAALLPCLGAALIIAYSENNIIGHLLSVSPLRWIGQRSFSLYLWHWPIITFYRELTGEGIGFAQIAGLIAVTFAAAAISYRFVEVPARRFLRNISSMRAVVAGGTVMATFAIGSLTLAAHASSIWPISKEAATIASYVDYRGWQVKAMGPGAFSCFVNDSGRTSVPDACLTFSATKRNVLLFGDSHAAMYARALRDRFPEVNWLQATHYGCAPVPNGWDNTGCLANVARVFDGLLPQGKLDGVVLASRWRPYQAALLGQSIRRFKAAGVDVTVIGPVPEYKGTFPLILARAIEKNDLSQVRKFRDTTIDITENVIRAEVESSGARYVSIRDAMCTPKNCKLFTSDGGPIAFDYGHLTDPAAAYAIRDMQAP